MLVKRNKLLINLIFICFQTHVLIAFIIFLYMCVCSSSAMYVKYNYVQLSDTINMARVLNLITIGAWLSYNYIYTYICMCYMT